MNYLPIIQLKESRVDWNLIGRKSFERTCIIFVQRYTDRPQHIEFATYCTDIDKIVQRNHYYVIDRVRYDARKIY